MRVTHIHTRLFILAMAGLISCQAQAENGQNLLDIYEIALSSDPTLAAARSGNLAAQEKIEQGKALYRPTVNFTTEASHSETDIRYLGDNAIFRNAGRESFEVFGFGVNFTQPILRKENWVQYKQAQTQVSQADKQLMLSQQDLMLRSAQAYFDVLMAQDQIDLINSQKAAIAEQLEQAKANFEVGTATITDVNEAQARFDLLKAQEITVHNDYEVRKRAVQAIIGRLPERLATVRQDLQTRPPQPLDMEQWVTLAAQNNLELSIQQEALQLASQEVERMNAGHWPTLDMVGSYADTRSGGSPNGFGTDLQNATIGLRLNIPLYQGGAISSRVREAISNQQKAMDEVEAARRKSELDTRQAYLSLTGSVAQVQAYEQALNSSQSQLDSTNLGYEVGVRNSVDVLNAQQQLFTAKRDLLQSRYGYLMNVLRLKYAIGLLNEADLAEVNERLVVTSSLSQ
ncbi:TolC family outer membrane protein [Methylobacillus arboreus]|uniref:TolC family outer membrane protein n=1 Tax=Methylobacillus arboreus TaxID=755170 RepID=UPI002286FE56|nr:TolC family outer membrane protein [Methylobacillus arboreus]